MAESKAAAAAEDKGGAAEAAPEEAPKKVAAAKAEKPVVEAPAEVAPTPVANPDDPLAGLSRAELARLRTAVEQALFNKGEDSSLRDGPSLREQSQLVPPSADATAGVDVAQAAKAAGIETHEVQDYVVRQAVRPDGSADGPAFLVVVDPAGDKHVSKL